MQLHPIETLDLPELQLYRTLRGNAFDRDHSFIADSPRVVLMLLEQGIVPLSLLATHDFYARHRAVMEQHAGHATLYVGSRALLGHIVGRSVHHHVMMHARRPDNVLLEHLGSRLVMTERLSNMENVGAIARSAAALGLDGYVVPQRGPHPYGRRAVRVSTGHVSRLQVHAYDDPVATILVLQQRGYRVYALEITPDAIPLSHIRTVAEKWVLILGNEETGVSDDVRAVADATVRIEMAPDVKSFNVAVAGAIAMHAFRISGSS